ncbi:hypothetical protein AB0D32_00200 [Micromonospora sp. NPDC048170]|uniref:hypothetical protein n=1 Tax=Micromonospora sp. NPDC048170 TaxID=3154819 RepID=UPI0033ED7A11
MFPKVIRATRGASPRFAWLIRRELKAAMYTYWARVCPETERVGAQRQKLLLLAHYAGPDLGRGLANCGGRCPAQVTTTTINSTSPQPNWPGSANAGQAKDAHIYDDPVARKDDFPLDNWHPGVQCCFERGAVARHHTINDWYLGRGLSTAGDRTDDEAPDRGPDTWLDRAMAGPDRSAAPLVIKSNPPARRRGKADVIATSAVIRRAPKPSVRELESEITAILRSRAQESVQKILHRKGDGWARLTSKEISLAVRRVQSRIKRTPKPRKAAAVAAESRPVEVLPPLKEIRRVVLHIHALRPLWATWEISRYLRNRGWSNVSTDLVRSILPPPGNPVPGTGSPAVKRRRAKTKKEWIGPKTRKALQQGASARQAESAAAPPPVTHRTPPEVFARDATLCPSCGVRISILGSCRCS